MPHTRGRKKKISSKVQPLKQEIKNQYDYSKPHLDHITSDPSSAVSCDISNVKKATQENDETLLSTIESVELDQIIIFLNRNHTFSQDALDSALILACRHGFKYLVHRLIDLGANVQFSDVHGNTSLLICVQNNFIDIVHFLLKKKADVNAFNFSGDTPLILSIKASGSSEMVKVLLEQEGIDVNHQNHEGHTALMKAIQVRDVDVMKLLMDKQSTLKVDDGINNIYKHSSLESTQTISPKEKVEQEVADKCGLGNIYHILVTHIQVHESPLVVAVEKRDTESLNMLLDCHFVEKFDICQAFTKIFKNYELKEVKTVSEDEIVMVTRLLECGVDLDSCWYDGSNPLAIAVGMRNYNLVELLCRKLKQQQYFKVSGTQALITAAKFGLCDIIDLLLKYNANINGCNYSGSPLDCALIHGHLESAKLLIQHGANMDIESALDSAVINQVPEYFSFLLNNCHPEVINYAAEEADSLNTLLLDAVEGGNLDIIGHLLDAGADINYQGDFSDEIPLGQCKNGDVAKFLISRGANVNIITHDGITPLVMILQKRSSYSDLNTTSYYKSCDIEVFKVLLENGASVYESQMRGKIPLMIAASNEGSAPMLQILLDHGADLSIQDEEGSTALMYAIVGGCLQNVLFLLQSAKKEALGLNVQNNEGLTVVMYAVIFCNPKILKELVNLNVDVNIKDKKGNTALHHAIFKKGSEENLATLLTAGSDVNCQNNDGLSPLMVASKMCWRHGILALLDSGADVNAISKNDSTKTAISFLSRYGNDFKLCLQALLSRGANSSYTDPDFLHKIILLGELDVIPELIWSGLGPVDIDKSLCNFNFYFTIEISDISPLCFALLFGKILLAKYFVGNLFLTNSDIIFLTNSKKLHNVLVREHRQDSLAFLDKISSQPMSLFQLVFVAVSSALGTSPGREHRVKSLPLPQLMKDKLLFKTEGVQQNIPRGDPVCLDSYPEMDYLTNFDEVSCDSDDDSYSGIGNNSDDNDVYNDW